MKTTKKRIEHVLKNSIAEEVGIVPNEFLLGINGKPVEDVFDYRYMIQDEYVGVLIQKLDGSECYYEIEKDESEDLGIVFASGLMDEPKHCVNQCVFCFIDQLPPHMRKTLYFKDDDARLSFLQGNYISTTNLKESDLRKIIFYHLSPINISVHATDLALRQTMLRNPNAQKLFSYIDKLFAAGIEMNFQIVLCKHINDGEQLDKTIRDVSRYIPKAQSVSVVPVGLTKYRDHLEPLEPFNKADCEAVLEQIENWQIKLKQEHNSRFVFASDEFYLQAEKPLPSYEEYEDFPQIENGVGMVAHMEHEFFSALSETKHDTKKRELSIVTGKAAGPFMQRLSEVVMQKFPETHITVYPIKNHFFGESINVSGLLTGCDIINQLAQKAVGERVLIPANALREQGRDPVFLDDITIEEIAQKLAVDVVAVPCDGFGLIKAVLY